MEHEHNDEPDVPNIADQLALENFGFWHNKVYYVNGQPLFTVDADDMPVPIDPPQGRC